MSKTAFELVNGLPETEHHSYLASNYTPFDLQLIGAYGSWAWNRSKRVFDALACYGSMNLGHDNDRIRIAHDRQANASERMREWVRSGGPLSDDPMESFDPG